MAERDKLPDTVRPVEARRISTDEPARQAVGEEVIVVREAPVTIDVEDLGSYTLLCMPGERRALAGETGTRITL